MPSVTLSAPTTAERVRSACVRDDAAILAAASVWMALRHRSLCGLGAGVALAAMHLPWGAGFLSGLFKDDRP